MVAGTCVEANGPRKAMFVPVCPWAAGFGVGDRHRAAARRVRAAGRDRVGIGHTSPGSTLIKWFPDRPGIAAGPAIMESVRTVLAAAKLFAG